MENRIRELREKKRMSQVRLSIELGVSQETVSAYESGKHFPSYTSLIKLSEIFGVGIDYLMGRSDDLLVGAPLDERERFMLERYRSLSPAGRACVDAYLQGVCDMAKA